MNSKCIITSIQQIIIIIIIILNYIYKQEFNRIIILSKYLYFTVLNSQ
jgi:hypothetical protein